MGMSNRASSNLLKSVLKKVGIPNSLNFHTINLEGFTPLFLRFATSAPAPGVPTPPDPRAPPQPSASRPPAPGAQGFGFVPAPRAAPSPQRSRRHAVAYPNSCQQPSPSSSGRAIPRVIAHGPDHSARRWCRIIWLWHRRSRVVSCCG